MGKSCFVISVIGEAESDNRDYADTLFEHIIVPAAKSVGYEKIQRADHIDESGMISTQVVEAILN